MSGSATIAGLDGCWSAMRRRCAPPRLHAEGHTARAWLGLLGQTHQARPREQAPLAMLAQLPALLAQQHTCTNRQPETLCLILAHPRLSEVTLAAGPSTVMARLSEHTHQAGLGELAPHAELAQLSARLAWVLDRQPELWLRFRGASSTTARCTLPAWPITCSALQI